MPPDQLQIKGRLKVKGIISFQGGVLPSGGFWDFNLPAPGTTLTDFTATTNDNSPFTIDWGNGSSVVSSGSLNSRTY